MASPQVVTGDNMKQEKFNPTNLKLCNALADKWAPALLSYFSFDLKKQWNKDTTRQHLIDEKTNQRIIISKLNKDNKFHPLMKFDRFGEVSSSTMVFACNDYYAISFFPFTNKIEHFFYFKGSELFVDGKTNQRIIISKLNKDNKFHPLMKFDHFGEVSSSTMVFACNDYYAISFFPFTNKIEHSFSQFIIC
jgi:hypothetical protein